MEVAHYPFFFSEAGGLLQFLRLCIEFSERLDGDPALPKRAPHGSSCHHVHSWAERVLFLAHVLAHARQLPQVCASGPSAAALLPQQLDATAQTDAAPSREASLVTGCQAQAGSPSCASFSNPVSAALPGPQQQYVALLCHQEVDNAAGHKIVDHLLSALAATVAVGSCSLAPGASLTGRIKRSAILYGLNLARHIRSDNALSASTSGAGHLSPTGCSRRNSLSQLPHQASSSRATAAAAAAEGAVELGVFTPQVAEHTSELTHAAAASAPINGACSFIAPGCPDPTSPGCATISGHGRGALLASSAAGTAPPVQRCEGSSFHCTSHVISDSGAASTAPCSVECGGLQGTMHPAPQASRSGAYTSYRTRLSSTHSATTDTGDMPVGSPVMRAPSTDPRVLRGSLATLIASSSTPAPSVSGHTLSAGCEALLPSRQASLQSPSSCGQHHRSMSSGHGLQVQADWNPSSPRHIPSAGTGSRLSLLLPPDMAPSCSGGMALPPPGGPSSPPALSLPGSPRVIGMRGASGIRVIGPSTHSITGGGRTASGRTNSLTGVVRTGSMSRGGCSGCNRLGGPEVLQALIQGLGRRLAQEPLLAPHLGYEGAAEHQMKMLSLLLGGRPLSHYPSMVLCHAHLMCSAGLGLAHFDRLLQLVVEVACEAGGAGPVVEELALAALLMRPVFDPARYADECMDVLGSTDNKQAVAVDGRAPVSHVDSVTCEIKSGGSKSATGMSPFASILSHRSESARRASAAEPEEPGRGRGRGRGRGGPGCTDGCAVS